MKKARLKKHNKATRIIFLFVSLMIVVGTIIFVLYNLNQQFEMISLDTTFMGKVVQKNETNKTIKRNIPQQTSNEGKNERYPTYGTSLQNITDEEKDNLLLETNLLTVSDSTYNAIDENGNLLLNGTKTGRKLYKHDSSTNMYYGDVSDSEPAVVQTITITPLEQRNFITGLYAPAGEVVKIEISSESLEAIGGELIVCVGQVSHRNNVNNIWKARNDFSRMPVIANKFSIKSEVSYVGNFFGGPIYIYPKNINNTFSVKISGACRYPYYIHGLTTKEEFEEMKNLSCPYFDFEVWDLGVRHSGPKKYANFDFDNLVKVGDLWEKICQTSRQVPTSANASIGVGFVYDCFVAAGEACAFQGGHSWVNAPCSWLSQALNYESITSTGFWGVIHEFNHLYQTYGMYGTKTNEVTNNATSLLSYVLYTNISSKRNESGTSLSHWNKYTNPASSLTETITLSQNNSPQLSLNCYADILHSFGTDVFIKATQLQKTLGVDGWYEALSIATGYNMTYYFEELLHQTISEDMKAKYNLADKTMFVPVATVYQTGRSYFVDGEEVFIETVKPFEIEKGEPYILDFNKYLIVPENFNFEILSISNPQNGTIEKIEENVYKYTPNSNELSGTIKLKIKLLNDTIKTKDVTITINLKQRIENLLNVTRYSYSSRVYNSVDEAMNNNFEGYTSVTKEKTNSTFINKIKNNDIAIIEGKVYIETDGNYAFCLRSGRGNNTLFLSVNNNENLQKVLNLNSDHVNFALTGEHVINLSLKAGDYVYFKEITLSKHYNNDAFTELGMANLSIKNQSMKTIPSNLLYNNNVFKTPYNFTSDVKYPKTYTTSLTVEKADISKQKIVSVNHSCWGESKIENILDGNLDTFYHNNQNNFVSETNPFILVVDLGENIKCNKIKITSRKTGQLNLPSTFKLFGGTDKNDLKLIGTFENLSLSGNTVSAYFEATEIRYYKLYVTDTKSAQSGNKYVTIAQIDFEYELSCKQINPVSLTYYKSLFKKFNTISCPSTFGKIIKGNGKIEYEFEGSFISMSAIQDKKCEIEIDIDGKTERIVLEKITTAQNAFSKILSTNKKHKIKINVISGNLCLDSLLVG